MTWVWFASTSGNSDDMVMFSKNAGSFPHYDCYIEDADGTVHCRLELDGSNRYDWKTNNATDYKDSTYHQYAWVTNRGADQPILYIDGISIPMVDFSSAGSITVGDISNGADLFIGRQDVGGTELSFNGSMANFMVFQEELSVGEINALSGIMKQPWEYIP